jgi:RNA 2',3'-cyclic 3'-phosphodiesterase
MEQLALKFTDEPAWPRRRFPERLFLAHLLESGLAFSIHRFARNFIERHDIRVPLHKPERLHVSLHHLGDFKRLRSKPVFAGCLAGNAVALDAFEVGFSAIRTFDAHPRAPGERPRYPLVLLGQGHGLSELHRQLGDGLRRNGLRAASDFTPHLTLCYTSNPVPLQSIETISIVVQGFALIHSRLGRTEYHTLKDWRLCRPVGPSFPVAA